MSCIAATPMTGSLRTQHPDRPVPANVPRPAEGDHYTSTWLITGCSTGLGRALAEAVIAAGHNAVVTARDAARVADLAEGNSDRVLALPLEVTDSAQVSHAVSEAEHKFGDIDVLVNNAGY